MRRQSSEERQRGAVAERVCRELSDTRSGHYLNMRSRYRENTMFNPDYGDLLKPFSAHRVEYVIVGAYAMAAYVYVRVTGDIDIFIKPTPEKSSVVYTALVEIGAPLSGIAAENFAIPGTEYQIGVPPNRIDILTAIDGLNVLFLELESLRRNKSGEHGGPDITS